MIDCPHCGNKTCLIIAFTYRLPMILKWIAALLILGAIWYSVIHGLVMVERGQQMMEYHSK